ncbi:tRNA (adenosine(37)-N6)-dimethylallyltransferase MiaA [Jeotgalibacillus sp. S-D1]|uniref:tRNA (adenosine(37)-N6)-dimethylallyltransferase MiaA n=1 Tax=Jeotgalibacillus sp. S-D1 TaxID=2552189 RepID=UPI0010593F2C|nr:tRNA (adenosine(37)-N6)-dimethylallyltransferase MiaA [Jeotgalibacillus sp. S-D1]TDL34966.1 tRNA (adenosine(37)-N6)-dimethylallyltransferase MiaA [Jeotgalibacillus sp. S-D1]
MVKRNKVIAIVGPTAVGKTAASIAIAKRYNGEVINGDSMQVYKRLDIGTAKITHEEMDGVPHHLFDIKSPEEMFSAAEYQQLVREKIEDITDRDKLPIIVGGTGLYIQSVLYDYHFSSEGKDAAVRTSLEKRADKNGIMTLYDELMEIDPISAEGIHPNNGRRVIRALEVFYTTGKTPSDWQRAQVRESLYKEQIIGLTMDRDLLYTRINFRVDRMIEKGLIEEVKNLYDSGLRNAQSIQAIGYKELYQYFDGIITLEQAIEQLKQNSRRYAKRQLTWFRNKMQAEWFDMSIKPDEKKESILTFLAGK